MGFDAALGAAHRTGGFSNVHIFPVTHEEGFPLTCWQNLNFFLNVMQSLCPLRLALGIFCFGRTIVLQQGFQQVKLSAVFMLSCTMSKADSSFLTWYIERLKARFSTSRKNVSSSFSVANCAHLRVLERKNHHVEDVLMAHVLAFIIAPAGRRRGAGTL